VVSVPIRFYDTLSEGMCLGEGEGRVRVCKALVVNLDRIQAGHIFKA